MSNDVMVVAEHLKGALADITFEMIGLGKNLASQLGGSCIVTLIGGSDAMTSELGAADLVVRVGGDEMADFNPESYALALEAAVDAKSPRVTLVAYTSMGMDLATTLAVKKGMAHASSCLSATAGAETKAIAQLYGGKLNVESTLGSGPCILSILAGATSADSGKSAGSPAQESVAMPSTPGRVRFRSLIEPEAGDVDITTQEVLVAIGRGIGSKDDIEIAEDLAEALNAAIAGSRPLIDSGWLPKSRQVGKSGLKVAPKLYLALGISGAPEHVEGMKGSGTIIAINSDKHAPIFNVAHYGIAEDLFDVVEELTEAIEDR
jgi:electron transfer flavoprotein alpha subunit